MVVRFWIDGTADKYLAITRLLMDATNKVNDRPWAGFGERAVRLQSFRVDPTPEGRFKVEADLTIDVSGLADCLGDNQADGIKQAEYMRKFRLYGCTDFSDIFGNNPPIDL